VNGDIMDNKIFILAIPKKRLDELVRVPKESSPRNVNPRDNNVR